MDLTPRSDEHKITTNIHCISTKNAAFGQSFIPKTQNDCNKLDNETKESSTVPEFKNMLCEFELNKCYFKLKLFISTI